MAITGSSKLPLHSKVLIGLIGGAAVGLLFNLTPSLKSTGEWLVVQFTDPIGQLFLRLLLMLVVPLVFSSLIIGVAGIGDPRALGRLGYKSLLFTVILSMISVGIGLGLTQLISPGKHLDPQVATSLQERFAGDATKRIDASGATKSNDSPLMQVVKTLIPSNPGQAFTSDPPLMLQVMVFALFIGVATLRIGERAKSFVNVMESLFEMSSSLISMVMLVAPYAVFCLVFGNIARFGIDVLAALGWFVATVLLGLGLQLFVVYGATLKLFARMSPLEFFKRSRVALVTAFSTSSSNATLPTALVVTEKELGVPKSIASFVLTIGATANQNGTALYEGVTVLFIAQLAGVDLTLAQQFTIALMAIIGGIGTAGVPSGSIPFIIVMLVSLGLNPALIGIILGADRILDMCRTVLNVAGDMTIAAAVARSEGHALAGDKTA